MQRLNPSAILVALDPVPRLFEWCKHYIKQLCVLGDTVPVFQCSYTNDKALKKVYDLVTANKHPLEDAPFKHDKVFAELSGKRLSSQCIPIDSTNT